MDHSTLIIELFNQILEREGVGVGDEGIRRAFSDMAEAYKPNKNWKHDHRSRKVNYNDAAHRWAYLHRHAKLHTGLACQIIQSACRIYSIKQNLHRKNLDVCSLGGGPGSEVVALIFVLEEMFGLVQCDVTVIDSSAAWGNMFKSIISELQKSRYGKSAMVAKGFFNYEYLNADLLSDLASDARVLAAVKKADLITMVKFISAAGCTATRGMIRKIFQSMQPGSMLLYVDNAGGGFYEMIQGEAVGCGMESKTDGWRYFVYAEPRFFSVKYGYPSQTETKVDVAVWEKPPSRTGPQMAVIRIEEDVTDSSTVHLGGEEDGEVGPSSWRCCSVL